MICPSIIAANVISASHRCCFAAMVLLCLQLNQGVRATPNPVELRRDVMHRSHVNRVEHRNIVILAADDVDPREPNTPCNRCGKIGTIVRATRHSEPPLVLHYCAECWPSAQSELEVLQQEELDRWYGNFRGQSPPIEEDTPPPGWTTASRSWHDVLRFLDLIQQPPKGGPAATPEILASIALDIRARASEMSGAMPPEVEDFIGRNSPPA